MNPKPKKNFNRAGFLAFPYSACTPQTAKHSKHNSPSMLLETSVDTGDINIVLGKPPSVFQAFSSTIPKPGEPDSVWLSGRYPG